MKNLLALVVLLFLAFQPALTAQAADMPKTGTEAPGFTLPNQEGKDVALDSFRGKWVVLYFYPKDFTKGCSIEAHNFQEDLPQYVKQNAVVVGVSVDTVDLHKSFCTKESLNFVLLSDADHQISAAYGSVMSLLGAKLAARHTFLISPKGVIKVVYAEVHPDSHSQQVLEDLTKLRGGDKATQGPGK